MLHRLSCVALVAVSACASTGSFETGRAYPRGEGAVMVGVGVGWQTGSRARAQAPEGARNLQLPWLPLQVDLFARVIAGIGARSEFDVTLTSPFWIGPHSPLSIGLSAGLKTSVVGADDGPVAAAIGVRAGGDAMTSPTTDYYRVWTSARVTGSWHPSDRQAGYLTPSVLAEWGRWHHRDAEGQRHQRTATALSYGLDTGWMRRGVGDRAYFGEVGGLWTPGRGWLTAVRAACSNCGDDGDDDGPAATSSTAAGP